MCLRKWPRPHPSRERLDFIHAVLLHVASQGITYVPAPVATVDGRTYVEHIGHRWELTRWMPGEANYHRVPTAAKLDAAMTALATFHRAAKSFPGVRGASGESPGIKQRIALLRRLQQTDYRRLAELVDTDRNKHFQFGGAAKKILDVFPVLAPAIGAQLSPAASIVTGQQPCLRDIWHDHVLFTDEEVTGIVDFGALQVETVATDIARLLGSLAGDHAESWQQGLAAYEVVRPLSQGEHDLITSFDRVNVLLSGMNWLTWIYVDQRQFENDAQVLARLEHIVSRMRAATV